MTFQPDSQELGQVIQLLQHSQSTDRDVQRSVQQQLVQLNEHQQFCCYLVYILSEMKQAIDATSRSLAGLLLKNNIRAKWNKYPTDVKFFVRTTCLKSIGDQEPLIRATVGIIVTTIVMEENMCDWPDLLDTLSTLLMQPDELLQEGALGALQKVFEDSADRYESDYLRPILPKVLIFYEHHSPKMRALAMNCVNCILMVNNDPIDYAIDQFLTSLFARHNDEDEEVQKQLCRSLTLLLDTHIDKMMPHLPNVIEYIIKKTQDPSESIALEACEFWLSIAENNEICRTMVLPHLDKLIPVLLGSMRYSESDPALKANDEDSSVPDRDEDIKPRFHKSKQHGMGNMTESDEEEDDDDEDGGGDWNIRRCSAASLDVLASIFGKDLLDKLFPLLKETLLNDNWLVKESGILALGAIAEGCMDGVVPHLGELIPFMLTMMFDKKPLVRSITCWTLSRYSSHVVSDENFRQHFFKDVLANLLRCALDGNKKVQEAACSAFATLEEEAGEQLVPYLGEILEQLVKAFECYQAKNLLILYDAIGTLANSVGDALSHPHYVQMLMPPLMQKWERLNDEDKELFPLLECISAIVSAMGQSFLPYIQPVFMRCCLLIEKCVQQNQQHVLTPEHVELAETDFIIVALDLLSGLAESLPEHMEPLVANSKLVELMLFCSMDHTTDVRQSCFALLGDLTKACPERVMSQSSNFIFFLTQNLDPGKISVCNNAIWALGELALKMGPGMKPYVPSLIEPLINVINQNNQTMQRTLLENTAITIGRIGQSCADELAPHIHRFIRPCCYSLRNIKDNAEKESAFIGLCTMININPVGVLNDFIFWCDAVASWNQPTDHLRALFGGILLSFKNQVGEFHWTNFIQQLPPPLRDRLAAFYQI
ncbi:unnamed protein product [Caenorhabditis sp. 36 PRJEB53466]|nr:unnamed protein product [Caenorhabditis sp. 36 PRJEB53466]